MVVLLNISRKFVTTSCLMARKFRKRANVGLSFQINAIEDAADAIERDPEGFGELEADLFNAHLSYKEHQTEVKRQKEQIRHLMVKNKYFKTDPLPNLLTYAEKEHIRYLHSRDEKEWTVEKLAECFPANAEIIHKIIKSNWSPLSPKRLSSHDATVSKNWERFKSGEFEGHMSAELIYHLKKFVDRRENYKISQNDNIEIPKKVWQRPTSTEFSSIISSLRPKNTDTKESRRMLEDETKSQNNFDRTEGETYLLRDIKNKKPITIDQLKGSMLFKESATLDQWAEQTNKNVSETVTTEACNAESSSYVNGGKDYTSKFITNEVVIDEADRKRYEMCATKHRIHIPRKLWRKGATYRTGDCYYDDDGELLYRVPGMDPQ